MKEVNFISYNGVQILYINFSKCSKKKVLKIIEEAKKLIVLLPEPTLLTLTNVEKMSTDAETVKAIKQFMLDNRTYVKKGAIIGLDKSQTAVYEDVLKHSGRHIPAFADMQKAKDWLLDRRQYSRVADEIVVEYKVIGSKKIKEKGVSKNLSLGGLCFVAGCRIERMSKVVLEVHLSKREPPLKIEGIVSWTSKLTMHYKTASVEHLVGIQFQKFGEGDYKRLLRYIISKYR